MHTPTIYFLWGPGFLNCLHPPFVDFQIFRVVTPVEVRNSTKIHKNLGPSARFCLFLCLSPPPAASLVSSIRIAGLPVGWPISQRTPPDSISRLRNLWCALLSSYSPIGPSQTQTPSVGEVHSKTSCPRLHQVARSRVPFCSVPNFWPIQCWK